MLSHKRKRNISVGVVTVLRSWRSRHIRLAQRLVPTARRPDSFRNPTTVLPSGNKKAFCKVKAASVWSLPLTTVQYGAYVRQGHAIRQVVRIRLVIAKDRVQSHATHCTVCVEQNGAGTYFFLRVSRIFLVSIILPVLHTYSFIYHQHCTILALYIIAK